MGEQRNRSRAGLIGFLGFPSGAPNGLSIHGLRPLLNLSGRVPFSKGISKGISKGGPTTRFRAARGALLDGYLINRRIAP